MNTSFTHLSNAALLERLKQLVQRERASTATLVAHLVEVRKRKLYLAEGYASMFRYCTAVLHLSEHATYLRLEAARMALRFPATLIALENGDLNLTSIRLLAPHLTAENLDELLAESRHRSRAEIEAMLARRFPRPDVPARIRKLPKSRLNPVAAEPCVKTPLETASPVVGAPVAAGEMRVTSHAEEGRSVVAALAPERYKVQFTASAATHAKLRQAQDLLRHRIPNGELSAIFELALTALVEKLEKEKFAATDRPRTSRETGGHSGTGRAPAANSRTIPAAVKRAVWERDHGQCAFIAGNQRRCSETGFLEFHHVVPFARGGPSTTMNIQLRCRAHNQFESILEFGLHEESFGMATRFEPSSRDD